MLPKATTQFQPTVDTDIMSDAIVCISKEKADSLFRNGTNPEVTIAYASGLPSCRCSTAHQDELYSGSPAGPTQMTVVGRWEKPANAMQVRRHDQNVQYINGLMVSAMLTWYSCSSFGNCAISMRLTCLFQIMERVVSRGAFVVRRSMVRSKSLGYLTT